MPLSGAHQRRQNIDPELCSHGIIHRGVEIAPVQPGADLPNSSARSIGHLFRPVACTAQTPPGRQYRTRSEVIDHGVHDRARAERSTSADTQSSSNACSSAAATLTACCVSFTSNVAVADVSGSTCAGVQVLSGGAKPTGHRCETPAYRVGPGQTRPLELCQLVDKAGTELVFQTERDEDVFAGGMSSREPAVLLIVDLPDSPNDPAQVRVGTCEPLQLGSGCA